jgi:hypothetical protein
MVRFLAGDILGAFRQNLLLLLAIPFMLALNLNALCRIVGKVDLIPLNRIPRLEIIASIIIIVFWFARNLPWFPFTLLAPEPW